MTEIPFPPVFRMRAIRWLAIPPALLAGSLVLLAGIAIAQEPAVPSAPVVDLSAEARADLEALGDGVVGAALPAAPIVEPIRLFHLQPGVWKYRIVAGANRGQTQAVRLERVAPNDRGATWQLVSTDGEIQYLRETTTNGVIKLAQEDADSDRLVVYRPGLVLDPGMSVGESKTVHAKLSTYKREQPDEPKYDGELDYTTRYLGAYRVETPAGSFPARLLEHQYEIKIGPVRAYHKSYVFYGDDVGSVAEMNRGKVSVLLLYNQSTISARVLLALPEISR